MDIRIESKNEKEDCVKSNIKGKNLSLDYKNAQKLMDFPPILWYLSHRTVKCLFIVFSPMSFSRSGIHFYILST